MKTVEEHRRELSATVRATAVVVAGIVVLCVFGPWVMHRGPLLSAAWVGLCVGAASFAVRSILLSRKREEDYAARMLLLLAEREANMLNDEQGILRTMTPPLRDAWAEASEQIDRRRREIEAEREKLTAVLDSMQDWVVAVDATGAILWVNEPLHQALNGAARAGNALVEAIRDPEVLLCVRVSLDEATVCSRRAMGVVPGHIFDVNVAPLAGGGAVVVLRDATPVEQAERTQREFIANVSHELRTPLTSISGYVETLLDREDGMDPTERNFLEIILKNAQRMTRLTEDLLTLARVESGEEKFTPLPVSAERLVTDAVASVRGVVKEAGATLTIGALAKDKVVAAPDAIVQVLSNLIENATRYGRPLSGAPAQVEVNAKKADDAVRFEVRDRGVGIALEHQERIFERFYRVDKARSRETGGTGLGLAIAKHIVEQNRGRIWVESELGTGSAFCFTLPLAG